MPMSCCHYSYWPIIIKNDNKEKINQKNTKRLKLKLKMKFCPDCGNILLPRGDKLYCKVCDIFFKLDFIDKDNFVLEKKIHHNEKDFTPIITKAPLEEDRITDEDRKAHEDYFTS